MLTTTRELQPLKDFHQSFDMVWGCRTCQSCLYVWHLRIFYFQCFFMGNISCKKYWEALMKTLCGFSHRSNFMFPPDQFPWTHEEFFFTQTTCWGQIRVEILSLNTTGAEQELPKDMPWKGRGRNKISWEVSLQDEMNFQNIKRLQREKLKFQYLSWDMKNSKCS